MKRVVLVLGFLSLLASAPVTAQNVIMNPGFDIDLSNWENPFFNPAVWDSRDAGASTTSGSALLTNTLGNGGSTAILSQCHEVSEGATVDVSAWVYQPSGQTGVGDGDFRFAFHSGALCQNEISGPHYSSVYSDLDTWFEITSTATAPPSAGSVLLYLAVRGFVLGEDFSVHFDDVVLTVTDGLIFSDGFESGNTSAWSSP